MIAAAQDDPGVYGICDCRFDPKAAALRNMTPKERRTLEVLRVKQKIRSRRL